MPAKRNLRRVAAVFGVGVLLLLVVAAVDASSLRRRSDAFHRRVAPIREGMGEAEVRAVAGPPTEFRAHLKTTDSGDTSGCLQASATAAMLYSFEKIGWIGEKVGRSLGSHTVVVCLDDRRRVIKTYRHIIEF